MLLFVGSIMWWLVTGLLGFWVSGVIMVPSANGSQPPLRLSHSEASPGAEIRFCFFAGCFSRKREMTFIALFCLGRGFASAIPAPDGAELRFLRVAGPSLVILVAKVAFHITVLAAFSPIRIDSETIATDQHNLSFLETAKTARYACRFSRQFSGEIN